MISDWNRSLHQVVTLSLFVVTLSLGLPSSSYGEVDAADEVAAEAEAGEGVGGQKIPWIRGPQEVGLGKEADLKLPEGFLFADDKLTKALLEESGNRTNGDEVGLVAPNDEEESWFLVFEYDAVGYVKDDEKDEIDADALLESISEGTEAANEFRKEQGGGELHVVGWYEKPHYDEASHNLVWAIEAKDEKNVRSVNYNVRLLGRRGVTSVTLVTAPAAMKADKPKFDSLLAGFSYKRDNDYAAFKPGDKIAQYGLTALVAGGAGAAAAKLGLFAKLGAVLAKGGKGLVAGVVAFFAAIARFFSWLTGRRKSANPTYTGGA